VTERSVAETGVLIALGANLGDPVRQVLGAVQELERRLGGQGWYASSLWRSRPLNCPPGSPDFVNAVIACAFPEVSEWASPHGMITMLQALERASGRLDGRQRNAPRPLDLDLLLYGDCLSDSPECLLPHPRALERRFVLEPAAEVAPDWIWPGTGQSIRALRDALRAQTDPTDIERMTWESFRMGP